MNQRKHKKLHKALNELLNEYTKQTGSVISQCSVFDFLEWSYRKTKETGEEKKKKGEVKDETETARRSHSGESIAGR